MAPRALSFTAFGANLVHESYMIPVPGATDLECACESRQVGYMAQMLASHGITVGKNHRLATSCDLFFSSMQTGRAFKPSLL